MANSPSRSVSASRRDHALFLELSRRLEEVAATIAELQQSAATDATLVDACADAWDVLDDLVYGDWSDIDQQRARTVLERIIEASDALSPRSAPQA